VTSGALDDRLGAYVILGLLPRLDVTCDWLLTVGEEWGQSTASNFTPAKDYDWIIEFDRAGTDVVMYQYEDGPARKAVEACGARMGLGSYSDIAYLEHVGVKAFNWGVGYGGNYHSESGYAYLNDTFAMVAKYLRFHKRNAGATMHHEAAPARGAWGVVTESGWRDEDCETCLSKGTVDADTFSCSFCLCCSVCGKYDENCRCWANEPKTTKYTYKVGKHLEWDASTRKLVEMDDTYQTGTMPTSRVPRLRTTAEVDKDLDQIEKATLASVPDDADNDDLMLIERAREILGTKAVIQDGCDETD